jgi:hypothetical protein
MKTDPVTVGRLTTDYRVVVVKPPDSGETTPPPKNRRRAADGIGKRR